MKSEFIALMIAVCVASCGDTLVAPPNCQYFGDPDCAGRTSDGKFHCSDGRNVASLVECYCDVSQGAIWDGRVCKAAPATPTTRTECGEKQLEIWVTDHIECRIDPEQVHERTCLPGTIPSGDGCIPDPTTQIRCAADTRQVGNLCVGASQPTPSLVRMWMSAPGFPASLDTPAWSYSVGELGIVAGDESVTVQGILPVTVEANIWWFGTTFPTDIQTATLTDPSGNVLANSGGPDQYGVMNFNIATPYRIAAHSIGRFQIRINFRSPEMTGIRYRFVVWPESVGVKSQVTGVQAAVDSTAPLYTSDHTLYHARPQFSVALDTPVGNPILTSGDYMQVGRFNVWNSSQNYDVGMYELMVVIKRSRAWSSTIRIAFDTSTERLEKVITPYQERVDGLNFYVITLPNNRSIRVDRNNTERINLLIGREGSQTGDRVEAAVYTRGTRWWENSDISGFGHDWLDAGPYLSFPSLIVR